MEPWRFEGREGEGAGQERRKEPGVDGERLGEGERETEVRNVRLRRRTNKQEFTDTGLKRAGQVSVCTLSLGDARGEHVKILRSALFGREAPKPTSTCRKTNCRPRSKLVQACRLPSIVCWGILALAQHSIGKRQKCCYPRYDCPVQVVTAVSCQGTVGRPEVVETSAQNNQQNQR